MHGCVNTHLNGFAICFGLVCAHPSGCTSCTTLYIPIPVVPSMYSSQGLRNYVWLLHTHLTSCTVCYGHVPARLSGCTTLYCLVHTHLSGRTTLYALVCSHHMHSSCTTLYIFVCTRHNPVRPWTSCSNSCTTLYHLVHVTPNNCTTLCMCCLVHTHPNSCTTTMAPSQ